MMNRLIGVALVLAAFAATEAYGQKKPKPPAKPAATALDSATLPPGEYVGILKSAPGTDRVFNVEIEQKVAAGGAGGRNTNAQRIAQLQAQIQQEQARAAVSRTLAQKNSHLRRAAQLQQQLQQAINGAGKAGGGKLNTKKFLVEFQTRENVKVRTMVLPDKFDDKGNPAPYTSKEKAELKGKDRSLPGYESKLESLAVGQTVSLRLVAVPKKKTTTPPKDGTKDKPDAPADETETNKTRQVRLIVILKEAAAGAAGTGKPGKKNK